MLVSFDRDALGAQRDTETAKVNPTPLLPLRALLEACEDGGAGGVIKARAQDAVVLEDGDEGLSCCREDLARIDELRDDHVVQDLPQSYIGYEL